MLNRKVIAILHATSHIHHSCTQAEKLTQIDKKSINNNNNTELDNFNWSSWWTRLRNYDNV